MTGRDPGVARESDRNVWIVNHHASVPLKDAGSARHLNMARYLPAHGWTATLIVASTVNATGKQALRGRKMRRLTDEEGVDVLWVRTNAYGSSMVKRLIGMLVFAVVLLLPGTTRGLRDPDVVIGSTVHPFAAWAGARLAKRHRVPFVFEVRDVWPDALIHMGQLNKAGLLARSMEHVCVGLAERADLVLSPLPNIRLYLDRHGLADKPFLWVANGFDGLEEHPAPALGCGEGFTFMYLGAHGRANALDGVMEAFDRACTMRPDLDLKLRLVGDGPLKPSLKETAASLASAERISFDDRIPKSEVISRAREADCLVANLHDSPVYEYGISPNKLFAYLYACRPVIFACSAPNNPIREARAGVVVEGDDRLALAAAFISMAETSLGERVEWARNGYRHVLDHYSHQALAAKLARGLDGVAEPHARKGLT